MSVHIRLDAVRRVLLRAAAACLAILLTSPGALAAYPDKPIHIVVPFEAGGVADIIARLIANQLSAKWPARALVENRPGAGGSIGTEYVSRAPADGYTVLMTSPGHTVNPILQKGLSWDPVTSFAPVGMVARIPNVIVTHPKFPIRNVRELLDYARSRPGEVTFASAGIASSNHLTGELLNSLAKIRMTHVPYKGQSPALNDLREGRVTWMALTVALAKPHIDSGALRAIAVTTPARSPALPGVPTVAESGVPGFDVSPWIALYLPAGTPPEVVRTLNRAVADALAVPEVAARLAASGAEVAIGTPEDLDRFTRDDRRKWEAVIREAGIQLQ